ncbi:MAG: N-acetylmuramic acid 6-phosphate etherase [Phycisphaerales bacterium]|nr:N-acetylmuramic acid 6-phosphate etherase [Phycisphaerales bacterium]
MFADRSNIDTEKPNAASAQLDAMPIAEAVRLMNQQDSLAVQAVGRCAEPIAAAVQLVAAAFNCGGRLLYVGAGTSGRLGVLDAAECPPTFSSDPSMVVGIIAGGPEALQQSIEGAEDDPAAGAQAIKDNRITAHDVVCGIAAGGTTAYVHGALVQARASGAKTIFILCTDPASLGDKLPATDVLIYLATGPEVITGSTRLKAGTATKLTLNTISTLAMVQIGKVFGNAMVDVDSGKNAKLKDRAVRIIGELTGRSRDAAITLWQQAGGNAKRAVVMHFQQCSASQADELLRQTRGRLRPLIAISGQE